MSRSTAASFATAEAACADRLHIAQNPPPGSYCTHSPQFCEVYTSAAPSSDRTLCIIATHYGSSHYVRNEPLYRYECPAATQWLDGACVAAASLDARFRQGSGWFARNEAACTVGNPVAPGSGIKQHQESDYAGAGAHPLQVQRFYRSASPILTVEQGAGWMHGYQRRLHPDTAQAPQQRWRALRANGELVQFAPPASGDIWTADNGQDQLIAQRDAAGVLTGWRYRVFVDDSSEYYDLAGKLLSIVERNGWTTTLTYSTGTTPASIAPASGLLIGAQNHFGRRIDWTYDSLRRIATMVAPGGAVTRYAYDASHNLSTVTWPDNQQRRYHYEDSRLPYALTGITDELGVRYATYSYDAQGRVRTTVKAGDVDRLELGYPAADQTTVTEYSGGSATQRTYRFAMVAGVLRPTSVSAPCPLCGSTQQSTTYAANGNISKTIGHDGKPTFYQYNAKRQEIERATFPASYASATTRPALSAAESVVSTSWDVTFNLPGQIVGPKRYQGFTYDAKGNITLDSDTETTDATGASKFSAVRIDSTRKRTYWTYNASSLPTTIRQTEGGDGNGVGAVETARWTFIYKADGTVDKLTDVRTGLNATLTGDASGLITRIDASNGALATFTPNVRGRMIKTVTPSVTVDFTIDARGLTNEIRFSDGRWIQYTHNAAHRLIKIVDNTGQVEQYAGIEPKWFIDEGTIRTAAAWLYLRGKRLSSLLVSEAHAQAAVVVVPVGIVLGLFMIATPHAGVVQAEARAMAAADKRARPEAAETMAANHRGHGRSRSC